ncbi:MAG: T9SS type A sorting domain-containing protein, partial [Bacteroidota bacterium]
SSTMSKTASAVSVAPNGSIIDLCVGGAQIAYSQSGTTLWSSVTTGPAISNDQSVGAIVVGGNVLALVNSAGHILTLAYDRDGSEQWTTAYGDTSGTASAARMKAEGSESYDVVGSLGGKALCLHYAATGDLLWANADSIPALGSMADVASDPSGNIVAVGSTSYDRGRFLTMKYSSSGANLLAAYDSIPWTDSPQAHAVAVDDSGNIFLVGTLLRSETPGDPNTHVYCATVKYNAAGVLQYGAYHGPGQGWKIAVDHQGNAYVAMSMSSANWDMRVLKYDPSGTEVWETSLGTMYLADIGGLVCDGQGVDVVFGGPAPSGDQIVAVRLNTSGQVIWSSTYNGATPAAMVTDAQGNIFVAGSAMDSAYTNYCITVMFSANGSVIWDAKYSSTVPVTFSEFGSQGVAIALDQLGGVYVVAKSQQTGSWMLPTPSFTTVLKYQSVGTGVPTMKSAIPTEMSLDQNYPNPFNPTTTIRYTVAGVRGQASGVSDVRLAVYDVLGREVAVLVNEKKAPGSYTVKFDASTLASGMYFYRLAGGGTQQVRKMLLIR